MTRVYLGWDCDGMLDVLSDSTMENIKRQLVAAGYWSNATEYDFFGRSLTYADFYQENYRFLRQALQTLLLRWGQDAADRCSLVLATNRQDPTLDAAKKKQNNTVLMEELLKRVRADVLPKATIDWTCLADLRIAMVGDAKLKPLPAKRMYGELVLDEEKLAQLRESADAEVVALEPGSAWKADRSLTAPLDLRKVELVRHQLETFRAQDPGVLLKYYFMDDDYANSMIPALREHFKANPIQGVELHLVKFDWQGIMFERAFSDEALLTALREGDVDALITEECVVMPFAEPSLDVADESKPVVDDSPGASVAEMIKAAARGRLLVASPVLSLLETESEAGVKSPAKGAGCG